MPQILMEIVGADVAPDLCHYQGRGRSQLRNLFQTIPDPFLIWFFRGWGGGGGGGGGTLAEHEALSTEVWSFLDKGAIEELSPGKEGEGIYSHYFLVRWSSLCLFVFRSRVWLLSLIAKAEQPLPITNKPEDCFLSPD